MNWARYIALRIDVDSLEQRLLRMWNQALSEGVDEGLIADTLQPLWSLWKDWYDELEQLEARFIAASEL